MDLNPVARYSIPYEGTHMNRNPKRVVVKNRNVSTGGISPGVPIKEGPGFWGPVLLVVMGGLEPPTSAL